MTLSSIAALQQALEALEQLIGPENDPAIGWSGKNGTHEVFACEFCGQTHGDCTKIPHTARCFVTKYRAALSSLRAVVKDTGEGWMPIESAPKDGTFYLAANARTGYYATLNEPPGCARGQWYWMRGKWVGESDEYQPSHWMPLPPPPKENTHG